MKFKGFKIPKIKVFKIKSPRKQSPFRFGKVRSMFKSLCGGRFKADKMGRVR